MGAARGVAAARGGAATLAGSDTVLIDFTGAAFVLVLLIATGLWYAAHVYLNCAPRVGFLEQDVTTFHNFRSNSQLLGEPGGWVGALTLRFSDAEDERHFAAGNAEVLCQRMRYLCWALSGYAAVVSVLYFAQKEASFGPAAEPGRPCHTRLVPVCAGLTLLALCALMAALTARVTFKTSPFLEHFVICWLALVLGALFLFHLRCQEGTPPASGAQYLYYCDMNFAYLTIALTHFIFVITPMRLTFFFQLCVVAVTLYLTQEAMLSVPEADRRVQAHITLVLLFSVLFGIVGKHHIEAQQRLAWTLVYQSARILNDTGEDRDSEVGGGSMIHKTQLALSKLSQVLEAISSSSQFMSPGLQRSIAAAKSHAEFAKEAFTLGDGLFRMTAKQALTGTEYEGNSDLVDFVKAAMFDPWNLRSNTLDLEEMPPSWGPNLERKTCPNLGGASQVGLGARSVQVLGVDVVAAGLGEKFSFSALDLARHTNNLSLIYAGERIMVGYGFCEGLGIEVSSFRAWVREIHLRYRDVPYHSEAHGAQVCALTAWLAQRTGWLNQADVEASSALFLAALGHDVGHIGRNNLFCTKANHPIALLWNDSSVLENMHAATCFAVMRGEADVLGGLDARTRGFLRNCIIRFILATDIKEHHSSLARLQARIEGGGFLSRGRRSTMHEEARQARFEEDVLLAGETLMKAGDIGHGLLPWKPHREWSYRVATEFFEQGDQERELGLPVSPLCDRTATTNFTISQEFFIEAFSSALFRVILSFTDASGAKALEECLESGQDNKEMWQIEVSAGDIDPSDLSREKLLDLFGRPSDEAMFPYEYDSREFAARTKVATEENLRQLVRQRSEDAAQSMGALCTLSSVKTAGSGAS